MVVRPLEHLEWLSENVAWFSGLNASSLDQAVPRCPGWDLEHLVVESPCLDIPISIGDGEQRAVLSGEPHDVLDALWGRSNDCVEISGERGIANDWLGLVEKAFAGR